MEILRTENLKKIYKTLSGEVRALDGVSLSVEEGEFAAIAGSSGSGKTTLLNMLGGLDYPTSGQVFIRGKALGEMNTEELTVFRRRNIGFVFQTYNLLPILNVKENITLPLKLDGRKPDTAFLEEITDTLKLREKLLDMPGMLSGGQQQRVAIARALSTKPAVLLCDEPTGALDSETGKAILKLLQDTCHETGMTVIVITHNLAITPMADRVIRLKNGKVREMKINENPKPVEEIEW